MGRYDTTEWDEDDTEQDVASDSNPMRELRAADRAKAKRIRELEAEMAELRGQSRTRAVKDVLAARGLNPKIAGLIPQDIDPTEEGISKWVDEFGDVFGVQQQESAPSAVAEDDIASLRQMDAVVTQRVPGGADAMSSRIANAQSREELDRIISGQV